MLLNVNTRYGDPLRVARAIEEQDPDLLLLEEIDSGWVEKLGGLARSHPYSITEPRDDNFGIGFWSKLPIQKGEIVYIGKADVPSIIAKVDLSGRVLHVFGTHPCPPGGPQYTRWRDEQLELIPATLKRLDPPILVIGDLNITRWSCHFGRLLERTGLRDSALGFGFQPTWPADLPFLWIPIDHCLYSDGIEIRDRRTGPFVKSDHFPLIVDLTVRD